MKGTSREFYRTLGLAPEASDRDIKRAYYKLSLEFHPDRCVGQPSKKQDRAKKRFQAIGQAYAVLGDPQHRELYDRTGQVPQDDTGDWKAFFESRFSKVTLDELEKRQQNYQGSEEEKQDLVDLYLEHRGDFNQMADNLLFYRVEDEQRYLDTINREIKARGLKRYRKLEQTAKKQAVRAKRAKKEAREAEKLARDLGLNSTADLVKKIHAKKENSDRFLNHLASKFCFPSNFPSNSAPQS